MIESERTKKDGEQPSLQCHTQTVSAAKANTVTVDVHVFLFVIHFLCHYGMCCVQNIKEKNKVSFPRINMETLTLTDVIALSLFVSFLSFFYLDNIRRHLFELLWCVWKQC